MFHLEQLLSGSLKILRVVEMLIKKSLQTVTNHFASVVAQTITKTVKFIDELDAGTHSQNLITVAFQITSTLFDINKTTLV